MAFNADLMRAKLLAHFTGQATFLADLIRLWVAEDGTRAGAFRQNAKAWFKTELTSLGVSYAVTEHLADLERKYWTNMTFGPGALLLEDGTSYLLLEDGTSRLLLESGN